MHLLRDQGVGKDGSPSRVKGQATQAKVIASLVAAGADINAHDADGRTPIHACLDTRQTCSNPDALPALVSCGACINARDNLGRTPLHYSIRNPSSLFPTVPMLVELGADINAMDNEGRTPLHCSILNSAPHVFALLVDRGADLTLRDHRGLLPIDYAYQRCIPAMTKYLRQHGSPAGNTGRRASVMFLRVLSDVFG
ncbi:MAG: ankyrin repeat domain-containing protein [Phycisphaerales bacterium]|nr:ankyrin repeat domain-containing protein [Phycisphaerales bacterium]